MKELFLLLLFFCLGENAIVKREDTVCDGVYINGIYHDKEVLKSDIDQAYMLVVDYSTNDLYFSYNYNTEDEDFKTARINLNTKEFTDIEGVIDGFAQTVDQENHHVYIGGKNGIYRYDHKSEQAELFGAKGTDIWMVYYNEILYYSTYPSQFLYTLINGESVRLKDLEDTKVDDMVIDSDNNIFYMNATGLFKQKKGTKDATFIKKYNKNGVRRLTSDINGNVFICEANGIYGLDKDSEEVNKILTVDDAFGLAFDNDNNIVYSDIKEIVRLKPNANKECSSKEVIEEYSVSTESP